MEYNEVKELLRELCALKGTSGAENGAADVSEKMLMKYMPVHRDVLGNVIGVREGKCPILLDAHIDQIGLIVTAIDDDGFVKISKVGGSDIRVLTAARVIIHGKEDVFGVITSVPPHLRSEKDEGKATPFEEITIDTGMTKEEGAKLIAPGDRITFVAPFDTLAGTRIASPTVDDRAGVAAILRCLQLLEGKENLCGIEVMFSAQEETGGSGAAAGAFNASSKEAIACDVSFASAPGVSSEKYASLGKGTLVGFAPALDYNMSKKLMQIACDKNIPAKEEVMGGRTGTNGDDIQIAGGGIKTGLLSIPIRNMHTAVEVVDLADIESTARLMAEYIIERSDCLA